MYLGLNLSHDASAALLDKDGVPLYACAEERISRVKNHVGIPILAINEILDFFALKKVEKVIVGSHINLSSSTVDRLLSQEEENPSNPRGKALDPYPSFSKESKNPANALRDFLNKNSRLGKMQEWDLIFLKHHDAHLGCGIPYLHDDSGLIMSLDGEGDGESGAISLKLKGQKQRQLARFSSLDSLGLLYAAVTKKYNFKPLHHEGKITGLAAYGKYSHLVDEILRFVKVENGHISLRYSKNKLQSALGRSRYSFGLNVSKPYSIDSIVEILDTSDTEYPDLAFAIQFVLEKSVEEIVEFWTNKCNVRNIALTGGVFANVKVNQKLTELDCIEKVYVFPNMGDGGISIGGVWSWMESHEVSITPASTESMFLGTREDQRLEHEKNVPIKIKKIPQSLLAAKIAKDVASGKVVALLQGSMEFGPRALGNTSILLDPRDSNIVRRVNQRLRRTEFMPFAPSVLEESFSEYFITENKTLQPFYFMAMTCLVRDEKRKLIPAVTHIDGSARPQIVSKQNNFTYHQIIEHFSRLTGIPILVNTSFNIHEEPIIQTVNSAVEAINRGAVDVVYAGHQRLSLV